MVLPSTSAMIRGALISPLLPGLCFLVFSSIGVIKGILNCERVNPAILHGILIRCIYMADFPYSDGISVDICLPM